MRLLILAVSIVVLGISIYFIRVNYFPQAYDPTPLALSSRALPDAIVADLAAVDSTPTPELDCSKVHKTKKGAALSFCGKFEEKNIFEGEIRIQNSLLDLNGDPSLSRGRFQLSLLPTGFEALKTIYFQNQDLPMAKYSVACDSSTCKLEGVVHCDWARPQGRKIIGMNRIVSEFREGQRQHLLLEELNLLFESAVKNDEDAQLMLENSDYVKRLRGRIVEVYGKSSEQLNLFDFNRKQYDQVRTSQCWGRDGV